MADLLNKLIENSPIGLNNVSMKNLSILFVCFSAVQDSSIGDLVSD